jgi:transposase
MTIRLTDSERSRIEAMARRARTRRQLYRAEALLALAEGHAIEAVARRMRIGIERLEGWVEAFEEKRLAYLVEPDSRPSRAHREGGLDDPRDLET